MIQKPKFKIRVAEPIITEEDISAVSNALREGKLSSGEIVETFEKEFSTYIGTKRAVAVNSGTAALHLCLAALNISKNDEVITTPLTFAATANVIVLQGAKPVFVDVESETYNLDPEKIEKAITSRTKAIMPIHYGGQCAEMDRILEIAERYDLKVIEDAAPAAGATYHGRKAGTFGIAAGFSFFPDKNITTGEGGMVTTNDAELAEKIRILRRHGAPKRYYHIEIGWNYKMQDFAAALGISQLRRLEDIIKRKNELAKHYGDLLENVQDVQVPIVKNYNRHTFMLYSIRTKTRVQRDKIIEVLEKEGIETRINFPPVHLQPIYVRLYGFKEGMFPVAEEVAKTILGLPIHLTLTDEDINFIAKLVKQAVRSVR